MTLSIPCRQFQGRTRTDTNDVYVDPLSVALCLDCTESDCRGAKGADTSSYYGPPRCAYEAAVIGRRGRATRTVTLPGPDPDGRMRTWECEVGV